MILYIHFLFRLFAHPEDLQGHTLGGSALAESQSEESKGIIDQVYPLILWTSCHLLSNSLVAN